MGLFLEFIDKIDRENLKKLKIIGALLESQDYDVSKHFDFEDSYIYVKNPLDDGDFGGCRIYVIGDIVCYRVQKEKDTEPYGKAYELDVEGYFEDLLEDHKEPKKAAEALIKVIAIDLKRFFQESGKAYKQLQVQDYDISTSNPYNKLINRIGMSPDYSSLVTTPR